MKIWHRLTIFLMIFVLTLTSLGTPQPSLAQGLANPDSTSPPKRSAYFSGQPENLLGLYLSG